MSNKPVAYEVTIAGTVYQCAGVQLSSKYLIRSLDSAHDPPNMVTLNEVSMIGSQPVTCPEVKLPLIDHIIRPVWRKSDDE